jgi:hypothetical protein
VRINSAPFVLPVSKSASSSVSSSSSSAAAAAAVLVHPAQAPLVQIRAQAQVQAQVQSQSQPPVQVAGALTVAPVSEQVHVPSAAVSSGVMVDDVDGVPLAASDPSPSPGLVNAPGTPATELPPPHAPPHAPSSSSRWDSTTSLPTLPTSSLPTSTLPTPLRPVERDLEEDDEALLVAPPACPTQRRVIDLLAQFTATDGEAFERVS